VSQSGKKSVSAQLARRRRNKILILLAVVGLIVLIRVVHSGRRIEAFTGDDYQDFNGKTFLCVRVVDGDTIDIAAADPHRSTRRRNRTRIRMWGIDSPELAHHGRKEMYFAEQARQFAADLMLDRNVRLELVPRNTRGYYGRLLAYVYLPDGRMYNALALEKGYAYADHRFSHPRLRQFLDLERQARQQKRGLWRHVTADDLPHWYPKGRLKDVLQPVETRSAFAPGG